MPHRISVAEYTYGYVNKVTSSLDGVGAVTGMAVSWGFAASGVDA